MRNESLAYLVMSASLPLPVSIHIHPDISIEIHVLHDVHHKLGRDNAVGMVELIALIGVESFEVVQHMDVVCPSIPDDRCDDVLYMLKSVGDLSVRRRDLRYLRVV